MKYSKEWFDLSACLSPLVMRVYLLLADRPHTKSELYEECKNWNNGVVKDAIMAGEVMGFITGGHGRGVPHRLTISGQTFTDWLLEGHILLGVDKD